MITACKNDLIQCEWNGQILQGRVLYRSKHALKVEILLPYTGWSECTSINGFHKASPYHFGTSYGDSRARELLIICYRKMQIFENKLPEILKMYHCLVELINTLGDEKVDCSKVIEQVIWREWTDWLFDEHQTGLVLSLGQEKQVMNLIGVALTSGINSFLQN